MHDSRTNDDDPYDLERFLVAQEPVFAAVRRELAAGKKETHWMWFVFPQAEGLGWSENAQHYAIRSLDEARAYLDHPVLGRRLFELAELVVRLPEASAGDVFGSPDDLKLRSSMTLFAHVAPGTVFERVLERFFGGERDPVTVATVRGWTGV